MKSMTKGALFACYAAVVVGFGTVVLTVAGSGVL